MIVIAKETLGLRRYRLSRYVRLLVPTFSLPNAPELLADAPSQQDRNALLPLVDFIEEVMRCSDITLKDGRERGALRLLRFSEISFRTTLSLRPRPEIYRFSVSPSFLCDTLVAN